MFFFIYVCHHIGKEAREYKKKNEERNKE